MHGTSIDHSKLDLIAHIHHAVTKEYALHNSNYDPLIDPHFIISKQEHLKASLGSMRNWLKRVETSRIHQGLLNEAKAKIREKQQIQFIKSHLV